VVSQLTSVAERVSLLEAGADDYLSKPFDRRELLARVRALLRRHPLSLPGQGSSLVQVTDQWMLDLAGQRVVGEGEEVALSPREFQLLAHMVRHEGVVLSREALIASLWGPGYEGSTREIDVYVRYLRRKLEPEPRRPRYIITIWGVGYRYVGLSTHRKGARD
jgi:DNA-binding response OmpR family regulator